MNPTKPILWTIRDRTLSLAEHPLIMGIVNVTPDSFSDGGRYLSTELAITHGLRMLEEGADLLDVGGESTRPGAAPVDRDEELRRVLPVIEGLVARANQEVVISVDTNKASVAEQALARGAHIVNDVTALRPDFESGPETIDVDLLKVIRDYRAGVVLMHSQGSPLTMQVDPHYDDVVTETYDFLDARRKTLIARDVPESSIVFDPGIGFGKTYDHNLALLRNLSRICELGRPLCLGVSRKGFLGRMLNRSVDERAIGSIAVACYAMAHKTAQILRVHDVAATRDAVTVFRMLDG